MKIVAVSGWKNSGKDMVADYLVREHGFKRVGFADSLKDMVADDYDLDRQSLDDRKSKEAPLAHMSVCGADSFGKNIQTSMFREFRGPKGEIPTAAAYDQSGNMLGNTFEQRFPLYWTRRALCILEGSIKRTSDSNYWVKRTVSGMKPGGKYVISDVRFQSELNALFTFAPNSVIAVRVERFPDSPSQDPSERNLDEFPFPHRINNLKAEGVTREQVFVQINSILHSRGIL